MLQKLFAKLDGLCSELDRKEVELQKEKDLESLYSQRAKQSAGKLQELESIIVGHPLLI